MMDCYRNSCVVSFQNVLEYFLNVNKDSCSHVVVVVAVVRSDQMSRKLYIERELLWKIVHFKEVWKHM